MPSAILQSAILQSVDEMPPDVRQKYLAAMGSLDKDNNGTLDMLENMNAFFEDKNNDGMPDAFDGVTSNVVTSTKIIAEGREYNGMDDLPPELRAKLSQAMGKLDATKTASPSLWRAWRTRQFRVRMSHLPLGRKPRVGLRRYLLPRSNPNPPADG